MRHEGLVSLAGLSSSVGTSLLPDPTNLLKDIGYYIYAGTNPRNIEGYALPCILYHVSSDHSAAEEGDIDW